MAGRGEDEAQITARQEARQGAYLEARRVHGKIQCGEGGG